MGFEGIILYLVSLGILYLVISEAVKRGINKSVIGEAADQYKQNN